jgi:hypothetical protein
MGHPRIALCGVSRGRRALGKGVTRPDSLIVVMNMATRVVFVVHVCRVVRLFPLQGCELTRVSAKPSDMGYTFLLLSFRRSAISPMFI